MPGLSRQGSATGPSWNLSQYTAAHGDIETGSTKRLIYLWPDWLIAFTMISLTTGAGFPRLFVGVGGLNTAASCGYTELESALRAAGAECSAAESHGVLCGMISATGESAPEVWLEYLLGKGNTPGAAARTARELLSRLYSLTLSCFADMDPGLELLLPDDAAPLPVRSKALGEWCQGYLYGLALGGVHDGAETPGHVAEFMHDLYEISHAGSAHDTDDAAEAAAYIEITEYVRLCVLLCYEELQPPVRLQ